MDGNTKNTGLTKTSVSEDSIMDSASTTIISMDIISALIDQVTCNQIDDELNINHNSHVTNCMIDDDDNDLLSILLRCNNEVHIVDDICNINPCYPINFDNSFTRILDEYKFNMINMINEDEVNEEDEDEYEYEEEEQDQTIRPFVEQLIMELVLQVQSELHSDSIPLSTNDDIERESIIESNPQTTCMIVPADSVDVNNDAHICISPLIEFESSTESILSCQTTNSSAKCNGSNNNNNNNHSNSGNNKRKNKKNNQRRRSSSSSTSSNNSSTTGKPKVDDQQSAPSQPVASPTAKVTNSANSKSSNRIAEESSPKKLSSSTSPISKTGSGVGGGDCSSKTSIETTPGTVAISQTPPPPPPPSPSKCQSNNNNNSKLNSKSNGIAPSIVAVHKSESLLPKESATSTTTEVTGVVNQHNKKSPNKVGQIDAIGDSTTSTTNLVNQPNPSTDSVANQIQKASNEPKSIDLSAIESNIECDQSSSSTPTTPMEDDSRCKLSGSKSFAQNGNESICKICAKHVYHMEQIKAVKSVFHKSCFRCAECNKQLNVDSYSSHEGIIYCKPHFKQLFQPKAVFENGDCKSTSAKQDDIFENINLDLSNIRNRFENGTDKNGDCDNKKANEKITRSESIHKIMQKYQSRVSGDKDNASSSDDEDCKVESPVEKGEKVSFRGMSALKSQWESGTIRANSKSENSVEEELAELRQKGKPLKQAYERAVQEAKSVENLSAKNISDTFVVDSSIKAGTIKERFEKGPEIEEDRIERLRKEREEEIHRIAGSETCTKEARNKFRQIEANMGKDQPPNGLSNGANGTSVEDISISSNELQQRFKYFENLKDNQPNFAKEGGDETDGSGMGKVDDIPKVDTTKKMLDKFKALEANGQANGQMNGAGVGNVPKSPIRITPPRETKPVYENEPIAERDPNIVRSSYKSEDDIHVEPEKAKNLRAKFENWQTEIERENRKNNYEEEGEYVPHIDTTKNLRAMFESIKDEYKPNEKPRPRINRFVQENKPSNIESCYVCAARLYPMEKMEFSGIKIHKNCFRCNKCHAPLRLDNFTVRAEKLFCIPHFKQMFMEKGNYDEGFGMEQHKDKWSNKTATTTTNGKSNGIDDAKMNGNSSLETKTNGTNGNGHLEDHFDVHSTDDEEHHEEATSSLEPEEREQEEYSYERDQIAELDDQPLDGPIIAVD